MPFFAAKAEPKVARLNLNIKYYYLFIVQIKEFQIVLFEEPIFLSSSQTSRVQCLLVHGKSVARKLYAWGWPNWAYSRME